MKEHFSGRLAALLIVVTTVVMSAFAGVRFYYEQKKFESEINRISDQISIRIASAVNPFIWEIYERSQERNFSENFASAILDSELKDPSVQAILVYGRFGHLYMGKLRLPPEGKVYQYNPEEHEFVLKSIKRVHSEPITNGSMTIGKVEVYFSSEKHLRSLKDYFYLELLQIGAVSFVIVLMLYLMIKYVLLKPMESLEVARRTFFSMDEGIVFASLNNEVFDVNPAFTYITGHEKKQIVGQKVNFFDSDISNEATQKDIVEKLNSGSSWTGESSCLTNKGQTVPVWMTITDVTNERGKVICRVYIIQDLSKQKAAERQLKRLAFVDTLTKLPNRRSFDEQIIREVRSANRKNTSFGLFYIDLDEFKYVNDTLGHSAGDMLLVQISKRFKHRIRDTDYLYRLGGDEFAVIAASSNQGDELALLADDLISLAQQPIPIKDKTFQIGASIGICVYPKDGKNAAELLKKADGAMYQARSHSRGTYAFFSSDMDQKVQKRHELRDKLNSAIQRNEFMLYYQPKIHLHSGDFVGAEALLRWSDAGKFIPPDEFIPVAEDTSLIFPIGYWVASTACDNTLEWSKQIPPPFEISINLSAKQLIEPGTLSLLEYEVENRQLNPANIDLEITESSIIEFFDDSVKVLKALKRLGFSISLDDFGTGYSSMSYLAKLPIDAIKVDKSFVFDIGKSSHSETIVQTILTLAKSLNMKTIAEGIETHEQLVFMRENGCDIGQGYYFSQPLPEEEFIAYMKNYRK